jgi:restriction system protein
VFATKGVFLTTSSFSNDALEFVKNIPKKIVLMDGKRLAELMVEYDVGVSVEEVYKLKKIDTDYFNYDDL